MNPESSKVIRRLLPGEKAMIWVDIETTGLNPITDAILEIGVRITNQNLLELARYTSLVGEIGAQLKLASAPKVVVDMHAKSGLAVDIDELFAGDSKHTLWPEKVERRIIGFLADMFGEAELGKLPMCGSSVHFDREFLREQMPMLSCYFSHRNIDVSSIKEACGIFNPRIAGYLASEMEGWTKVHRVQEDLDASIRELKFYATEFLMIDASIDVYAEHDPAQLALFDLRCPKCSSPQSSMHPAVSGGGEVTTLCTDPFHA